MKQVQTNHYNIQKGTKLFIDIKDGSGYEVISVRGDNVHVEALQNNQYGFKRKTTFTLTQIGKGVINKDLTVVNPE